MTNSRATPNDRLNAVLLYNSYNPKEYLCSFNVLHQIYVCCSTSSIWSSLWKPVIKVFTTCTTRCGFVNDAFGFAARKASRHQLHKHVNAHVYLGVLAYYAKQRPSRCGEPHEHGDEPFAWYNFRISRFGVCNLISEFGYHLIRPLEARIWGIHDMYNTLWFRERRVWATKASVTWVDMCIHVFASSELGSNRARVSRRACICCALLE